MDSLLQECFSTQDLFPQLYWLSTFLTDAQLLATLYAGAAFSKARTSPLYAWCLKEVGLGETWLQTADINEN